MATGTLSGAYISFWCGKGVFILNYLTIVTLCTILFIPANRIISITAIDIAVIIYLLGALLNIVFIRLTPADPIMIYRWIIFIMFYIVVRNSNKKQILWLIVISGVIQVFVGFIQLVHLLPLFHRNFTVTGTFSNPGPYGGFLALTFTIAFWLLRNQKYNKKILWIFTIIIGTMMVISNSRAALVAAFIGITIQLSIIQIKWVKITGVLTTCIRL